MPSIHMNCPTVWFVGTNKFLTICSGWSLKVCEHNFLHMFNCQHLNPKSDLQHLNLIVPFIIPNMRLTTIIKKRLYSVQGMQLIQTYEVHIYITCWVELLTGRKFKMSYRLVALTSFSRSLSTPAWTKECDRMSYWAFRAKLGSCNKIGICSVWKANLWSKPWKTWIDE
jgi:hypothetical protein